MNLVCGPLRKGQSCVQWLWGSVQTQLPRPCHCLYQGCQPSDKRIKSISCGSQVTSILPLHSLLCSHYPTHFVSQIRTHLSKRKKEKKNLPLKMLWKKIKANIHMPCSVQSPPSYAFSSSSDRCLPGFLVCALGLRLNICHSLEANRSKSLLWICPRYFSFTRRSFPPSLCARSINEPPWLSYRGERCVETPLLRVLLLVPVFQKGCWKEGVKPRCVRCWVRAGYERFQKERKKMYQTKAVILLFF